MKQIKNQKGYLRRVFLLKLQTKATGYLLLERQTKSDNTFSIFRTTCAPYWFARFGFTQNNHQNWVSISNWVECTYFQLQYLVPFQSIYIIRACKVIIMCASRILICSNRTTVLRYPFYTDLHSRLYKFCCTALENTRAFDTSTRVLHGYFSRLPRHYTHSYLHDSNLPSQNKLPLHNYTAD